MEGQKFVIKFDVNKVILQEAVSKAESVDKTNLKVVEEMKKKFVKFRTTIKGQGLAMREQANAYNKEVLNKEKEYLSIIAPTEEELGKIIVEEKQRQIMQERMHFLSMRKDQIKSVLLEEISEEELDKIILSKDEKEFLEWYNELKAEKEQKEKEKIEQKKREERIRKEAGEKAKAEVESEIKEKEELEERKEKEVKEKKEKKDEKRLKNEKYQKWLKENGYNEKTDKLIEEDGEIKLYRLVSVYK